MPKTLKEITFSEGIDLTLSKIFKKNNNAFLIGLGANDPKFIFGTTKSISKNFKKRVFDMPLSENSMTGIVLGASLNGLRPILVHQRLDFSLLSMEQIINQCAKWFYMFDGKMSVPIVIRMIVGRGWGQGPQHSQSLHSIFSHIPGLKVVLPSTTESGQQLLLDSFYDLNPTIFIEHRWLHNLKGKELQKIFPRKLGNSKILKKGKDITIIATSYMTIEVLRILDYLKILKIDIELIDLQTVSPIDIKTLKNSVKKTGRVLVLDVGHKTFGISAELITTLISECYNFLKIKPERLASLDYPVPTSYQMAKYYYPNKVQICQKIFDMLEIKKKIDFKYFQLDVYQDQPFREFTGPF
jgi:pyruvate dehydrogenase E1 component beta subunit